MITIREAISEDVPAITLLSHQLGYPVSADQTLQNITALKQSGSHEVFVAVDQQQVVGWAGVSYNISVESLPVCEIHGLVVDERYRSKGIGKLFIERAKVWSSDKGVGKLRLRCNVKRDGAHRFYINAGFTEIKRQKVFEIQL
jgi:GNAT superfamily N-acetyltransferase